MKKLKISVEQLFDLLDEMREAFGTSDIYIYERNGLPAICDADDEANYIIFSTGGDDEVDEDLH